MEEVMQCMRQCCSLAARRAKDKGITKMADPTSSLSKCMEPEPECKRGLEARCNTDRKQPPVMRISCAAQAVSPWSENSRLVRGRVVLAPSSRGLAWFCCCLRSPSHELLASPILEFSAVDVCDIRQTDGGAVLRSNDMDPLCRTMAGLRP
jgi:hypothetical protein